MNGTFDVAIVGGGPAGLSAAIWLARYLHSVVLIDSGDPRNWETRGVNGYLGLPNVLPADLRARGRDDARTYGATLIDDCVHRVQKLSDDEFVLTMDSGGDYDARRLLLSIGLKDVWPDIPGLDRAYGETAHVCPDCDGYEKFARVKDGRVRTLELESGMDLDVERIFFAIGQYPTDGAIAALSIHKSLVPETQKLSS